MLRIWIPSASPRCNDRPFKRECSNGRVRFTEKVYAENEWYEGPRSRHRRVNGVSHRFKSLFDEQDDQYLGTFLVWPIDKQVLDQEIEQWQISSLTGMLYMSPSKPALSRILGMAAST